MKNKKFVEDTPLRWRDEKLKLSRKDSLLMKALMEFGESIDPEGCDDGDYDKAMKQIKNIYQ